MDFGIIIIVLLIIGSSLYKNYREYMRQIAEKERAGSGKKTAATGETAMDRMLKNIVSEIENSREAAVKKNKTIDREAPVEEAFPENDFLTAEEDKSTYSPVSDNAVKGEKSAGSGPLPLIRAEKERVKDPGIKDKNIIPDYSDGESLLTGFIYATVLGDPVCRSFSSFSHRRKL